MSVSPLKIRSLHGFSHFEKIVGMERTDGKTYGRMVRRTGATLNAAPWGGMHKKDRPRRHFHHAMRSGPDRVISSTLRALVQYNTIQYNIRLLKLDRMQADNTGSGYA